MVDENHLVDQVAFDYRQWRRGRNLFDREQSDAISRWNKQLQRAKAFRAGVEGRSERRHVGGVTKRSFVALGKVSVTTCESFPDYMI
jgi:hypothetical protein